MAHPQKQSASPYTVFPLSCVCFKGRGMKTTARGLSNAHIAPRKNVLLNQINTSPITARQYVAKRRPVYRSRWWSFPEQSMHIYTQYRRLPNIREARAQQKSVWKCPRNHQTTHYFHTKRYSALTALQSAEHVCLFFRGNSYDILWPRFPAIGVMCWADNTKKKLKVLSYDMVYLPPF